METVESILGVFFLALQARINSLTYDSKKVIRYIDHDLGFLDQDVPAISCPAVLIDMSSIRFSDMTEGAQLGEGPITLKLVFAPYSDTNNITPDKWKKKGLQYYEIEDLLNRSLHGWKPEYLVPGPDDPDTGDPTTVDLLLHFQPMMRRALATDKRRQDLRIRTLTYDISFEDYGTVTPIEYIDAPDAEIEFNADTIITDSEAEDL